MLSVGLNLEHFRHVLSSCVHSGFSNETRNGGGQGHIGG